MGEIDRWANIHPDLLNEIARQFYSYDDHTRFRIVCKEWHSKLLKVPKTSNHKTNPWLVLPGVVKISETRKLEEEEIYHLTMPEMQNNFIRGSCYGWLICVMTSDGAVRMLNPFTKAHFDLPPMSVLPEVISYNPGNHGAEYTLLDLRDDEIFKYEGTLMHQCGVHKLVVSCPPDDDNDDFMAVAIYGACCRLAFYRRNDRRWRDIPTTKIEPDFEDVIFFHEKIYAIDTAGQLYEFDTKIKPLPVGGIYEALSSPDIRETDYDVPMNKYLIGCEDGSLRLLVRYPDPDTDRTCEFDIFVLDKDAKEWLKIHSLGNYKAIIGYNTSTRILAHTFPDDKCNHIYYTDNTMNFIEPDIARYHDIGIFNLEDSSSKKLLSKAKFSCPPVWLLPW